MYNGLVLDQITGIRVSLFSTGYINVFGELVHTSQFNYKCCPLVVKVLAHIRTA